MIFGTQGRSKPYRLRPSIDVNGMFASGWSLDDGSSWGKSSRFHPAFDTFAFSGEFSPRRIFSPFRNTGFISAVKYFERFLKRFLICVISLLPPEKIGSERLT
jgi:hypothetical protein